MYVEHFFSLCCRYAAGGGIQVSAWIVQSVRSLVVQGVYGHVTPCCMAGRRKEMALAEEAVFDNKRAKVLDGTRTRFVGGCLIRWATKTS